MEANDRTLDMQRCIMRREMLNGIAPGGAESDRRLHGDAYRRHQLSDPVDSVYTSTNDRLCVKARQPCGLMAIANAGAAMREVQRAVQQVVQRSAMALRQF